MSNHRLEKENENNHVEICEQELINTSNKIA